MPELTPEELAEEER